MQARYYDPVIGRFYSNDPVGFNNIHNFNRYTYANNNPYKYIDPDGRNSYNPQSMARYQSTLSTDEKIQFAGLVTGVSSATAAVQSFAEGKIIDGAIKAASVFIKPLKIATNVDKITVPYKRPNNATTPAQRQSVQGQPCVDCGTVAPTQVADHKTPLVVEYYTTGTIDKVKMKSIDAVQPQCPQCSAMSQYSKLKKKELNL